jgi:penicillin-binding protein 1A
MRAVAADGLIRLPAKVNAMSTAPPFGSRSGHDWLIVGTADPATRHVAREPATPWRLRLSTATARLGTRLGKLRDCTADILHSGRATSKEVAAALLRAVRERSVPSALAAPLLRIGNRLRPSWDWRCVRNFGLLRAHPVAATLGSILLLSLGYVAYCVGTIPSDGGLLIEPTPSALVVEADGGQVFATRGVFKGDKLAPQDVPLILSQAIIAIEDRHFYEHTGFYLPSLMRAAFRNFLSRSAREGGSTISQQLARMTYLSQERTIKRKVQEAILTYWIEHRLTKQEILTNYLNTAYFGAGVYGVDAAAKRYFGKTAKELSLSESALLAGLVRAPSSLAPTRNLDGARQRAALVLDAMVETGAISRAQADAARQQPAALRVPPDNPPGTNYFVDMLNADVKRLVGPVSEDLTLRSTLDLNLQSIA